MIKSKLLASFLTLFLMGAIPVSLSSCSKDDDPPVEQPGTGGDETDDPSNPEDPTDPEDPSNPEDPTESEDPENPSDPEDPSESEDPEGLDFSVLPAGYPVDYALGYVKMPENTPEQYKEYTSFALSYNNANHTPNYVSWELLNIETIGSVKRDKFSYWVDKSLDGCLDTDYAYNTYKYERGHMCPAADNTFSEAAMRDCMVMSNMAPQLSKLNSGLWSTLENKERTWAKRDKAVWIVAGPIYDEEDDLYIGKAQARVPSSYFKAFLYYRDENPRAIAFVMVNDTNPGNLKDYAMSIDDLEELTGYDFFSALPDDIENQIEATFSFTDWDK